MAIILFRSLRLLSRLMRGQTMEIDVEVMRKILAFRILTLGLNTSHIRMIPTDIWS
jgi:hypothetical protein